MQRTTTYLNKPPNSYALSTTSYQPRPLKTKFVLNGLEFDLENKFLINFPHIRSLAEQPRPYQVKKYINFQVLLSNI